MEKKFEMTEETLFKYGITFHRIKSLRKFGEVEKGDLGGWIEHEYNLSHDGNAWVGGEALVYGNVTVKADAWISGNAEVFEDNHVISVTGIFENGDTITFCRDFHGGILAMVGGSCMNLESFDAYIASRYPELDDSGVLSALVNLAERRIKKS